MLFFSIKSHTFVTRVDVTVITVNGHHLSLSGSNFVSIGEPGIRSSACGMFPDVLKLICITGLTRQNAFRQTRSIGRSVETT